MLQSHAEEASSKQVDSVRGGRVGRSGSHLFTAPPLGLNFPPDANGLIRIMDGPALHLMISYPALPITFSLLECYVSNHSTILSGSLLLS